MKLKKILSAILAVSMMAAVTGCGGTAEKGSTDTQPAGNDTQAAADVDDDETEGVDSSEGGDSAAGAEDFTELYGEDTVWRKLLYQMGNEFFVVFDPLQAGVEKNRS